VDSAAALRAGRAVEAMLLEPILRPMVDGAGTLGDYQLGLLAREVARNDARGFAALLASRLEGRG
jgi:hypothetical protein